MDDGVAFFQSRHPRQSQLGDLDHVAEPARNVALLDMEKIGVCEVISAIKDHFANSP